MNKVINTLLVGCGMIISAAHATTWGPEEVNDPILRAMQCKVSSPMSYGSYIYHWPSKYDQVFWPDTVEPGIWSCEHSGFVAFFGDFSLSSEEEAAIRSYLKTHYKGKTDIESKLQMLERLYAIRDTTAKFDNHLLRVLARWYQQLGQYDKADEYRRKALADIEQQLPAMPDGKLKLEYLYVAANYSRQFGKKAQSNRYLKALKAQLSESTSDDVKGYAEYLSELLPDTAKIQPGGKIDPPEPETGKPQR